MSFEASAQTKVIKIEKEREREGERERENKGVRKRSDQCDDLVDLRSSYNFQIYNIFNNSNISIRKLDRSFNNIFDKQRFQNKEKKISKSKKKGNIFN